MELENSIFVVVVKKVDGRLTCEGGDGRWGASLEEEETTASEDIDEEHEAVGESEPSVES